MKNGILIEKNNMLFIGKTFQKVSIQELNGVKKEDNIKNNMK